MDSSNKSWQPLGVTEANAIKLGQRAKEKFQEICEEEGVPL